MYALLRHLLGRLLLRRFHGRFLLVDDALLLGHELGLAISGHVLVVSRGRIRVRLGSVTRRVPWLLGVVLGGLLGLLLLGLGLFRSGLGLDLFRLSHNLLRLDLGLGLLFNLRLFLGCLSQRFGLLAGVLLAISGCLCLLRGWLLPAGLQRGLLLGGLLLGGLLVELRLGLLDDRLHCAVVSVSIGQLGDLLVAQGPED